MVERSKSNNRKDGAEVPEYIGLVRVFFLQVTARCLGIDISKVYLCDTATDKVPNASPTAASASSDLYGLAIMVSILWFLG